MQPYTKYGFHCKYLDGTTNITQERYVTIIYTKLYPNRPVRE